jgi:hypothetical protein
MWVIRPTRRFRNAPLRRCGRVGRDRIIGAMTTSPRTAAPRHAIRTAARRPLVAALVVAALGLGASAAALGLSSSPGRIGPGTRPSEVAIPGVRGTGSGGGTGYGVSTSPGRSELAIPRKAGGQSHDYL